LRILHQAIDTLPPQTRKIILLGLNGKNNNEIAEALNISVNTVKSLKKSAYTSLRGQLKDPMLFLLFLLIDS
jgi:RNA polymerase sigma-70 factor (ECF subfamily)